MTADRYETFAALHVSGTPLILFNAWDAGSAGAVAKAGAKAIATGSASVAMASGFGDGEALPMADALANAARIVAAVDLPVTVDFEGGYAVAPEAVARNVTALAGTGAIGCNFEDQMVGGEGLYPVAEQAARIAAVRAAAGAAFFINARTDIFLKAPAAEHDLPKVEAAIERARAYADAGASGFFVPGLLDLALLERVTAGSPLPVNVMWKPGAPDNAALAAVGVARISHGPFPYLAAMAKLEEAAQAAMA
jgi:2-methylisocitrate lyase-like PEP mutase family enzyme